MKDSFLGIARKVWFAVFALALASAATYILPIYVRGWQTGYTQSIGLDADQYKNVFMVYGFVSLPCYILSGWLTDKFNPKKLMIGSLIMTGVIGIWFAGVQLMINQNYGEVSKEASNTTRIMFHYYMIFSLWGFSTVALFWSPLWKILTQITKENVEKTAEINGLNSGFTGLVSVLFAGLATAVFSETIIINIAGFKANNMIGYLLLAFMPILAAISIQCYIAPKVDNTEKFTFKETFQVFKNPLVVLVGFVTLSGYIFQTGVGLYASALFTNHLQAPSWLFFILSMIFYYLARFIISPIIGKRADKSHSYTLWTIISIYAIAVMQIMILLVNTVFMPGKILGLHSTVWWILVVLDTVLFLSLGIAVWAFVTLRWSLITEIDVKKSEIGSVVGAISMIGFSADAWMLPILEQISKHNYIYDLKVFTKIDNQIGMQQIMLIMTMFSLMFSLAAIPLYYLLWKKKYKQFYQTKVVEKQPIHWLTKLVLRKYIKMHHWKNTL